MEKEKGEMAANCLGQFTIFVVMNTRVFYDKNAQKRILAANTNSRAKLGLSLADAIPKRLTNWQDDMILAPLRGRGFRGGPKRCSC
jgi:hypothetical protein